MLVTFVSAVANVETFVVLTDGVDGSPCETEKSVSSSRGELGRECVGKLNSLVLDSQATDGDVVGAYGSRGSGTITVLDLPRVC